jgi:hypothetical protein
MKAKARLTFESWISSSIVGMRVHRKVFEPVLSRGRLFMSQQLVDKHGNISVEILSGSIEVFFLEVLK